MRPSKGMLSATAIVIVVAIVLCACGGNAGSPNNANNAPAPPPSSGSGGSSGGSGGSGSGGSGTAVSPTTYTAGLISFGATPADKGTLAINNGTVTYKISGWVANAKATVGFCAYPVMSPMSECFDLKQTVTTDSTGAASGSFKFPKSGVISGTFHFDLPGTNQPDLSSGFAPTFTGGTEYSAAIVKFPDTNATFGNGSVTVNNGTVSIRVGGLLPSTTYGVWEGFSTNGEDQIGSLVTDASGNGNVSLGTTHGGGLLVLRSPKGSDVSSGFVVP